MSKTPVVARSGLASIVVVGFTIYGIYNGLFVAHNQAFADSSKIISLYFDGQKKVISTDVGNVGDVLHRAGVTLANDDLVEPSAVTKLPQGFFNINVYRARPVVVIDNDRLYQVRTAYQSPKLMAASAGITTYEEDNYETEVVTNFVGDGSVGQKVIIHRAKPLKIAVDGKLLAVRSQGPKVADVLAEKGIALGQKDSVSPGLETLITMGMKITISRVADVEVGVDEVLPKTEQIVPDSSQPIGISKVKIEGSDGRRHVLYHIHYLNGVETARDTIKIDGIVKPVAKVTLQGTRQVFAGSVEFWRPKVEAAAAKWGVDANRMLRIMACESGGDASNYNGRRQGVTPQQAIKQNRAVGLFQFKPTTWDGSGGGDIWDGDRQVEVAAWKMGNYGFGAWECK